MFTVKFLTRCLDSYFQQLTTIKQLNLMWMPLLVFYIDGTQIQEQVNYKKVKRKYLQKKNRYNLYHQHGLIIQNVKIIP